MNKETATKKKWVRTLYAAFLLTSVTFPLFDVSSCRMNQWLMVVFLTAPVVYLYLSSGASKKEVTERVLQKHREERGRPLETHEEHDIRLTVATRRNVNRLIGFWLLVVFWGLFAYALIAKGSDILQC